MGDGFRIAKAFIKVTADDEGLHERVAATVREATAGVAAHVRVTADGEGLAAQVRAEAAAADTETHVRVTTDADSAPLREGVRRLGQDVAPDAERAGSRIGQALGNGLFRDANGSIRNSSGQFASEAEKLAAGIRTAGDESDKAGRKAAAAGGGFRIGAVGAATLVAAAIGLGPALGAIPALAGGGIEALGTLAGAFFGVSKAIHDYGAEQNAVTGPSSQQAAVTAYSNAMGLRDAKQAIVDVTRQGAQQEVASAEQVANAQRSVADAVRQAGVSEQSSLDGIAAANQRYRQAVASAALAQRDLTAAQAEAENQQADLNNSSADAALAVDAARLALEQAQRNDDATSQNSLATDLQKRQSALTVAEAQQKLTDDLQRAKEATQASDKANAAGVNGMPAVVSAQQQMASAVQAVADAQHGQEVAQRSAAEQAVTSAEQISKAQQSLADAQRSADLQRADSAEQLRRAQQSLMDTVTQQGLAASAAAATGGAAANQYAKDMRGLTDQGREFVTTAIGMKDVLHELSATAQTATLPGFTQMLTDSRSMLPVVNQGVHDMGTELSDTAIQFGHLFQNPGFQASASQFTSLMTGGFGQFASALPPLLSGVVSSGVKAGPIINAVASGIHDIVGSGLPAFLSGLSTDASGSAQGVSALFHAVDDLLGPVGTLVGATAGALGPALADLEPDLAKLAVDVEQALLPIMPQLSTDLRDVAAVVDELFHGLEPLIPVIADDLSSGLQIIDPLLRDTAKFLHDNADWLPTVAEGVLYLVAAVKAWHIASGLADTATKTWKKSMELFGSEGKIATNATKAWKVATSDLVGTLGTVVPVVGTIVGGSLALGQWLGSVGDHAHDAQAAITGFTGSIIDLSQNVPGASQEMDNLARTAVGFDRSVGGGAALMADLDTSLSNLVAGGHADEAATAMHSMTLSVQAGGGSVEDLLALLPKYSGALGEAGVQTKQAGIEAQTAQQPFQGLTLRLQDTGQAGRNSAADLGKLDKALAGIDAQVAKRQALDDYNKALGGIKDGAAGAARSIDGNSQSAMDNRRQLEDAVTAARHFYDSQIAAHTGVDIANASFLTQIDNLRTQAEKTYGSKKAVDDFMTSLGLVPTSKSTKIDANTDDGVRTIKTWQTQIDALHGPHVDLTIERILGPGNVVLSLPGGMKASTNADGGPVKGGEVSWVGERGPELVQFDRPGVVIPNHQIRQVGPATSPAAGAPVINLNYYGTTHPTAEQRQLMYRDLALAVR